MRIVEHKVLKFAELSPKAKEHAIEKHRQALANMGDIGSNLPEVFEEVLRGEGFINPKVFYSLNYAQGDGVAFMGSIDPVRFLKGTSYEPLSESIGTISILHSGRYFHSQSMEVLIENDGYGENELAAPGGWNGLREFTHSKVKELSKQMERLGYDSLEYEECDGSMIDLIEANGYEFYEDGTLYTGD